MKLSSDNETLAEKKALILYVLDKINKPINNNDLLRLLISVDNINYFYFQQFLLDLLANKYIINYNTEDDSVYEITEDGKHALELVKDIIPGYLTFKIDNSFKGNLKDIKNEKSVSADFFPDENNGYIVKCKIIEDEKTVFETSLLASSREQAKKIVDKWMLGASELYPTILDLFNN